VYNQATAIKFLLKSPTTNMTTPKHAGIAGSNLFDTRVTPIPNDVTARRLPETPSYLTPFQQTWGFLAFANKVTSTSMHKLKNI